jgi:hypothetical protein
VIVKRCGCVEPGTQRRLGRRCSRLGERGHGSWYFHCTVATTFGTKVMKSSLYGATSLHRCATHRRYS